MSQWLEAWGRVLGLLVAEPEYWPDESWSSAALCCIPGGWEGQLLLLQELDLLQFLLNC